MSAKFNRVSLKSNSRCSKVCINCILGPSKSFLIFPNNSGFNWDPPTFWTTLGISIVALYFALVSIIQGVLSVSPGRLKASRGEIDYWSQWTQWNISFAQLRLRTTAYVPIIQHPTTSLNLAQDDIRIPTAKETKNRSLSIRIIGDLLTIT